MIMRRIFFCAVTMLALFLVLAVPRAMADDPNRLSQLRVEVWPEYDRPTVLVMYDGTLADATGLPRQVSVLVPTSATGIIPTFENADGTLAAEQPFTSVKQADGFTLISYSVKTANYHIEYYDDLVRGGPDKTMDFVFKSPAPADQVTLEIQQPSAATNFVVTPAPKSTRTESGFTYSVYNFTNVTSGQALTAQAKYYKADQHPSVLPTSAPDAVPATAPAVSSASTSSTVFIVIALVLLLGVALLGFYIFQQRYRTPSPALSPSRQPRVRKRAGSGKAASAFCTQCAATLGPEDNFCPKCGAKRRPV